TWEHGVDVGEIAVIFDDDLDEDLINLHHHRTPHDVLPTLVRDYRIEVDDARGQRHVVAEVADNRMRHRRHQVQGPAAIVAARLIVSKTNGAPAAHVVSFRAWAPTAWRSRPVGPPFEHPIFPRRAGGRRGTVSFWTP